VVSDLNRKILLLCCIAAGSVHDYALMKKVFKPGLPWFKKVSLWLDLGFLGADKDYKKAKTICPTRNPGNPRKTPTQA
jgi:hypothetical protein